MFQSQVEFLQGAAIAFVNLLKPLDHGRARLPEYVEQDKLFVVKVVPQGRLAYANSISYGLEGGGLIAVFSEQACRCLKYGLFYLLGWRRRYHSSS